MIMADGYGGIVASSWRCHTAAWVLSQTDTQAVIRVEARFQAVNNWYFTINGISGSVSCDGQSGSGTGNANISTNGEAVIYRKDFTVSKTDSARSVSCSATVSQSYFNAGSSSASCTVSISGIAYKIPNAPLNTTFTRESDSSVMIRWTSNWDNAALKPWKQIAVDWRSQAGGASWSSWSRRATLTWSVTNYQSTGLFTNGRFQFALFAINQAGQSSHIDSVYIHTTPAAPKSVSVQKQSETSILISVDGSNAFWYTLNLQRLVNGVVDSDFGTKSVQFSAGTASYTDTSVPAGDISYRARIERPIYGDDASKGVLYSTWATSATVTTIQQPLAPTVTSPPNGDTYAVGTTVSVAWTPNHPDRSAQEQAQIELVNPAGTTQTISVSGATTSHNITDSTKGTWQARVRTKGLHDDWGAWSSWVTWTLALPPDVTILGPDTVTESPFTISWSIADETGVSQQTVTISAGNRASYTASPSTSTRSLTIDPTVFLPVNGEELLVTVLVRGGSTLTDQESRTIPVEYTPPALPTVTLTPADGYAMMIQVDFNRTNPGTISQDYWTRRADDGTSLLADFYTVRLDDGTSVLVPLEEGYWMPETVKASVERVNPDGSVQSIADGLQDGDMIIDHIPPLNVDYEYRVTAFTAANSSADTSVTSFVESDRPVFNFGSAGTETLPVGGAWRTSEHPVRESKEYHFADDTGLPMSYATGELDNQVSVSSAYLYDQNLHTTIRHLSRTYHKAWLRLIDGSRMRCSLSMSQSLAAHGQMVDFQADCTEIKWQEATIG